MKSFLFLCFLVVCFKAESQYSEMPKNIINNDYATQVSTADLNNDGYLDVISLSRQNQQLLWYKNEGEGSFSEAILISEGGSYDKIVVGHFDDDNFPDIITTGGNGITLFRNSGEGSFEDPLLIHTPTSSASKLIISDIDQDGDKDLVLFIYSLKPGLFT